MKKDKLMRKNSFIKGALLVTLGIIITKILGILYVIPFHALIGEKGGALYGYAYTIYVFFISLSTAGIPLAISKLVSEYNTMGNYDAKDRVFYLGKKIALIFGIICFIFLNIFASFFAKIILGDLSGGNTISDVTLVIRIISTAILIVPVISIYRGYYQGHKFMEPYSLSQVIEQLFRVLVIIVGSFLALKVFKLSLTTAVGVAVFGATIGALVAYIYLVTKMINNKSKFKGTSPKIKIPVSDRELVRKIFYYAIPLILIDISKSIYSFIDTFSVVNGLVNYANYTVSEAETIMSMLSTWATKFNMIISSIATGIVVSLVPNLTQSIVNKNNQDINSKVNQAIGICLYLTIPMVFGISFLSRPLWTLFYGYSDVGPSLLAYFIFTGLASSLFTVIITIIHLFKDNKILVFSLFSGVIIKLLFNVPLISSFYRRGFSAYYGVISATIFAYLVSIVISLVYLNKKSKINFEGLLSNFFDILCGSILMLFVLFIFNFLIPLNIDSRLLNLLIVIIYSIIGAIVYFFSTYKFKTVDKLFGKDFINKIIKR